MGVEEIRVGDVIRTRKSHPCGDIKIKCNTCGRVVMLDRERFLRQRKAVIYRMEE